MDKLIIFNGREQSLEDLEEISADVEGMLTGDVLSEMEDNDNFPGEPEEFVGIVTRDLVSNKKEVYLNIEEACLDILKERPIEELTISVEDNKVFISVSRKKYEVYAWNAFTDYDFELHYILEDLV